MPINSLSIQVQRSVKGRPMRVNNKIEQQINKHSTKAVFKALRILRILEILMQLRQGR